MPKISTTIQLPEDVMKTLNQLKAETGMSKNIIIEKCLRALFEGRIFNISKDILQRLKWMEENLGSDPSFIVENALRLFFSTRKIEIEEEQR